ncbi:MAG: EamA family transporter [bacterium]|nr:EamA family transporter [bacterium]
MSTYIWISFSFVAAMLWALDNILDKHILTNKLKSAHSYNLLTNMNDILPVILIPLFARVHFDPVFSVVALLFGALTVVSLIFYNKAIIEEEASRIASLEWISPIFVAILSFVLFGEKLSFLGYWGILLIVIGAFVISHKKQKKIVISRAIGFIIIFSFLFAIGDIISDYSFNYIDFWSFFFWASIGSVISSLSLLGFPKIRREFWADMQIMKMKAFLMILVVSILYYIAEIFFYAALSLGPVSLVVAIVATQPMFTFVYALGLSLYKPEFLKEQFDGFNIATKLLGIIIIICGASLITIF